MKKSPKAEIHLPKTLSLYVWDDFAPDYTSGLAVAIATSETMAKAHIIKRLGYDPLTWGDVAVYVLTKPMSVSVTGGAQIADQGYGVSTWGELKVYPLTKPMSVSVSGGG